MSRSGEKFAQSFKELEWFVKHHQKSAWLVPTDDDYRVSALRPKSEDLPAGTRAILYSNTLDEQDFVQSSKQIL